MSVTLRATRPVLAGAVSGCLDLADRFLPLSDGEAWDKVCRIATTDPVPGVRLECARLIWGRGPEAMGVSIAGTLLADADPRLRLEAALHVGRSEIVEAAALEAPRSFADRAVDVLSTNALPRFAAALYALADPMPILELERALARRGIPLEERPPLPADFPLALVLHASFAYNPSLAVDPCLDLARRHGSGVGAVVAVIHPSFDPLVRVQVLAWLELYGDARCLPILQGDAFADLGDEAHRVAEQIRQRVGTPLGSLSLSGLDEEAGALTAAEAGGLTKADD
jgi:hypothetical protein